MLRVRSHSLLAGSNMSRSVSSATAPRSASSNPISLSSLRNDGASLAQEQKNLRMLIYGKPGSGKGTLSSKLVNKFNVNLLSTGDLLRQHILEKTEVGKIAEGIMAKGDLLPDEVVLRMVTDKLDALRNMNWILDGFPRTLGQGELLDAHLKSRQLPLTAVVYLDVPDEIILSRIAGRWIHQASGRVYNLSYRRPIQDGLDDITGEPLTKRSDDNPEVFKKRLERYYHETSPLLEYYQSFQSSARLIPLKGRTSDEIWPQLEEAVRAMCPTIQERATSLAERHRNSLSDPSLAREYGSAASEAMGFKPKL